MTTYKVYEEMIAFQTIDVEGDIWCNIALVFKDEDSVRRFFKNPKLVIETLKFEIKDYENIDECIEIYEYPDGFISSVFIRLEYCDECKISRMKSGYIIE